MNTHDIDIELPEPDWYLVMSADGDNVNVELRASDEDAVNAALDMGGMVEIHRLITIDKTEAFATAAIEADRKRRGEPYSYKRIGWELERTAMGDGFYGNALRVAKDIPGVSGEDWGVLDRYATGKQQGTDHIALQDIARNIYMTPQPADPSGASNLHKGSCGAQNENQAPQPAEPDVEKLVEALESLLEMQDEDCRYDHEGYCQSHNLDHVDDGCRVARAKTALAAHRKGEEV